MPTKMKWTGKVLTGYENSTKETVWKASPLVFYDDFIHAYTAIPAYTAAESGMAWSKRTAETGGTPTVVCTAGVNGLMELTIDNTEETQDALLYMTDRLLFNFRYGMIFEARVRLYTLPTTGVSAVWGVAGAYAADPDNVTYNCWFRAVASGAILVEMDDNATDTDDTATGITALATDWKIYKIDASNYSSVKFYIDGVPVASSTTFAWAATEGNSVLQPYFCLYKGATTGVANMQIDYVKIWNSRS
jgi:hypothetical protein